MSRPNLTAGLQSEAFRQYYWLKDELAQFCRAHGLSATGSKALLAARIEEFLTTGKVPSPQRPAGRKPSRREPETFTLDTVMGPCFRCSQKARAFFQAAIGPTFHFNTAFQAYLRAHPDQMLGDAVDAWHRLQAQGPRDIPQQFEYNRHMRRYFSEHPGASRQDALQAWWERRGRPMQPEETPG